MQVILLKKVRGVDARIGDVVEVRDGYARNYLLPQGIALRATPQNKEVFERQKAEIEEHDAIRLAEAHKAVGGFEGVSVVIKRQAGDDGRLYGSVTTKDVAAAFSDLGLTVVDARHIDIPEKIKSTGVHTVFVSPHPDVRVSVTVSVLRQDSRVLVE